jgi:hypothetical protein
MSRSACLSLVTGVSLLLVALVFFVDNGERVPVYSGVDQHKIQVEVGSRVPSNIGMRIRLDKSGMGVITLPVPDALLQDYSFAHLLFDKNPPNENATMFWKQRKPDSEKIYRWTISSTGSRSRWITLSGIPGWTGEAGQLGIIFLGPAGSIVELKELSLRPFTAGALARSTYQEWTSFLPWTISSINRYTGSIAKNATLYPVPSMALMLGLCILVYIGVCQIPKTQRPVNWKAVWGLTLSCWILLDVVWQTRLFRQLENTHDTFAGKAGDEKILASSDAELFDFISNVKKSAESTDAKVFVVSSVDYLGMRGAYYLYPRNVYWNRYGLELPDRSFIRRGDYIVAIRPGEIRYNSSNGELYLPQGQTLAVQRILSQSYGEAFRAL